MYFKGMFDVFEIYRKEGERGRKKGGDPRREVRGGEKKRRGKKNCRVVEYRNREEAQKGVHVYV